MITKITGEQPFQVLTNNFSISPSNEGYTLQISADGTNFSNLFTVGAGVTRLVTGVAANSYYRLSGNQSEVSINWMKVCVTEGGGGGDMSDYYTKEETDALIQSAITSGVSFDGYWTSGETETAIEQATEDLVTSADVKTQIEAYDYMDQEDAEVISTSLNDLEDKIEVLSGRTVDLSGYYTSAQTDSAITMAVSGKADAANVGPNAGNLIIPNWNTQGIITGEAKRLYNPTTTINGKAKRYLDSSGNGDVPPFWAPQSAGTSGQILKSTGAVPEWITPATINGSAITAGGNIEIQAGGDMSAYWTSAETQSAITSVSGNLQSQIDTIDVVVSDALNDLNGRLNTLSASTVTSQDIRNIVKIQQTAYNTLVSQSATSQNTLYVVIPDAQ